MEKLNDLAVNNFREYLQIPSVHPNVDYSDCVKFLKNIAFSLELPVSVIYLKPNKPVVIITWEGKYPHLPSILLSSHMDVVPVIEEEWKHKPFGAELIDGKIYARGAQDMKSVGIAHLESIRRLKIKGITCLRTIHVCFVPDEEIGGAEGMKLFVQTNEFKNLNVSASFDESCCGDTENYILFFGEKTAFQFDIRCKGKSGHGSLLLDDTPGEKINHILKKAHEYRDLQKDKLKENPSITESDITSLNCTIINGGVQRNVIPCEMTISFDCRLAPTENPKEFEKMIIGWCKEAGSDCDVIYRQKDKPTPILKLDYTNIYWLTLERTFRKLNLPVLPEICFGNTDSRHLREVGVNAFGFTPFNNTPPLLHSENEFLDVQIFLKGIEIFQEILVSVANIE